MNDVCCFVDSRFGNPELTFEVRVFRGARSLISLSSSSSPASVMLRNKRLSRALFSTVAVAEINPKIDFS
jgi:hypothetical protein